MAETQNKDYYWTMYDADVWAFHKKYINGVCDDEFWQSVVSESGQIAKQFDNDRLCRDLLLAVLSELERKEKELRDNDR